MRVSRQGAKTQRRQNSEFHFGVNEMANENLAQEATLKLTLGHLLVVWDVLSNKLSGTDFKDSLTNEEKRAIWGLEDLCERTLVEHKVEPRFESEWEHFLQTAREHVKTIPADFVD
jgi:hypothetical protein